MWMKVKKCVRSVALGGPYFLPTPPGGRCVGMYGFVTFYLTYCKQSVGFSDWKLVGNLTA